MGQKESKSQDAAAAKKGEAANKPTATDSKPADTSKTSSKQETMQATDSMTSTKSAAAAEPMKEPSNPVLNPKKASLDGKGIQICGRYVTNRGIEDDYKLEPRVVGSGMSGPVHLATGKNDGRKYAVKSFKKRGLSDRRMNELKNEVNVYMSLDHPHVAHLEMVFETDNELHLVMEFMAGGELYDRLSAKKQYTEENAAATTRQMLLAVGYLHSQSLAHRDLKLENFLYEKKDNDVLKLIDFGFAKFWDRATTMSQACGSVHYVAPEVLQKSYTNQADMWSLGVIVYMLLTGSPPFFGSDDQVLGKIKAGAVHWSSRFKKLSTPAQDFCRALLVKEPDVRLTAQAALDHPWMQANTAETSVGIDTEVLSSIRDYAHASHFKRSILSMMAWSLSTEDRASLHDDFMALDTENKGTITHKQMLKVLEENFHISPEEAEAVFKGLGPNDKNEIAYSEFLAAALQSRVKVHEDVLRKTFCRFDMDSSGFITRENLCGLLGSDFNTEEIDMIFKEVDTSHDGGISYEEFIAYFHKPDDVDEHQQGENHEAEIPEKAKTQRDMKRKVTQKLGKFLDKLVVDADEEHARTPGGSLTPAAHKALVARDGRRAKTAPTGGYPAKTDE